MTFYDHYSNRKETSWDEYTIWMQRKKFYNWMINCVWNGYLELIENIHFDKPIKILELGAASGLITKKLAQHFNTSKITIVDKTANNIRICEAILRTLFITT